MIAVRQLFFDHLAQTSDSPLGLEIIEASGCYLRDVSGKKYLDLISGISVSNTGHCHPDVVKAVNEQAGKYMHLMVYGEFIQSPQVQLANELVAHTHGKLDSVYFVNSGSEAVEGAIKLARRVTGRPNIVVLQNAYHGSTTGALSLIGSEEYRQAFAPLFPGVKRIRSNCISDLETIDNQCACVIAEPVQGEAGIIRLNHQYLIELRKRCDKNGALLVFDEIQSGIGRTGTFFAYQQTMIEPDILLLAKALGGGMPLGAFMAEKKYMSLFTHNPILGHITTFGGHPVSCAAGLASLKVIEKENLLSQVKLKEEIFLKNLKHKAIREIRSVGLLIAVQLDSYDEVSRTISYCIEKGLIIDWFLFNSSSIRIAPPLTISEEQILFACQTILEGLDRL